MRSRRGQPGVLSLVTRDYRALFPGYPSGPALFRLFRTPSGLDDAFLVPRRCSASLTPTHQLIHPMRESRSPQQSARKGGGRNPPLGCRGETVSLLNQWGWCGVACETANVADQYLSVAHRQVDGRMIVPSDTASMPPRRSRQSQSVSARRVAGPYACGDGAPRC